MESCKYVDTEHMNKMLPDKVFLSAKISCSKYPVIRFSAVICDPAVQCPVCSSSAVCDRKAYRIVEHIPSESSEDDASGSDDEWLPEKQGEGSGLVNASSSDSESEDAEGAVGGEVADDVPPDRAQKKIRNIWKTKDNQFEGELPHFLGEWKVNAVGTEPIDFFIHLFPEDLKLYTIPTCMPNFLEVRLI